MTIDTAAPLLRRVRWANVARLAAALGIVALVLAWPHLAAPRPALPPAEPVAVPRQPAPPAPVVHARSRTRQRKAHHAPRPPAPRAEPRRRRRPRQRQVPAPVAAPVPLPVPRARVAPPGAAPPQPEEFVFG
jgi:hypothetical protein